MYIFPDILANCGGHSDILYSWNAAYYMPIDYRIYIIVY